MNIDEKNIGSWIESQGFSLQTIDFVTNKNIVTLANDRSND